MNYTLKQLRDRVDQLIANQGEDAHCVHGFTQRRLSFEG